MAQSFNLFEQHLFDLKQISPEADDVFVCPICLSIIARSNIDAETVDLGHVWPSFLRNLVSLDTIKHQQVLLCKSCNSSAGSRGDHEMQEHEKVCQGLLPSNVWILPQGKSLFMLKLNVTKYKNQKIILKLNPSQGEWLHNPRWKKFREVADGKQRITIAINQFTRNWKLAQVGWLTSAYLYAFYTFGYRYVLQTMLDPVREYIRLSFSGNTDDRLSFESQTDVSVRSCKEHNYQEPRIEYISQTQGSIIPSHFEISLLHYHTRLPVPLRLYFDIAPETLPDPQMVWAADATGHMPHEGTCDWEMLLAQPDYEVIGTEIFRRNI